MALDLTKMAARTVLPSCPSWCTRDHKSGRIGLHTAKTGETDTIVVQLAWWPTHSRGFVQILDLRGDLTLPAPEIDTDNLPAFARLMERLGHPDVAEELRAAHAMFAAGVAAAAKDGAQ